MKKPFPIFVDLESVPPLVIGNAVCLEAKIRLLLKFAPLVELIVDQATNADHDDLSNLEQFGSSVRILPDASCADAVRYIKGRPLVILDTMDDYLNQRLSDTAKALGVPVNVPDQVGLCNFYLASIVDRAPVVVAISTSGMAPVLGQNIRAKLEDMLVPKVGDLAHYLWNLRDKLRHLPSALRRSIQHQIIDGSVFRHLQAGHKDAANAGVNELLNMTSDGDKAATVALIEAGAGAVGLLSLSAVTAIRSADAIFFDENVAAGILDMARREAYLEACFQYPAEQVADRLTGACDTHHHVIHLIGGDPRSHNGAFALRHALRRRGIPIQYIASASNDRNMQSCDDPSVRVAVATTSGAQLIKGVFQ